MPPPESPPTTKAWSFTTNGPPRSVLTLTTTPISFPPTPPPTEEYIQIRTSYTALNPGDLFTTSLIPALARKTPTVPGLDLVGTVLDVYAPPTSIPRFKPGDRIVALVIFSHILSTGCGALAETVSIPAKFAVKIPDGVGDRDVAGLMVAGCTAVQVVDDADIKRGHRVLVVGGSGGIGSVALQIVRDRVGVEGTVVVVCSGRNEGLVKELGGDEVIDYTKHDIPAELASRYSQKPFDAIIDCVGADESICLHCDKYLKEDGMYSSVGIKLSGFTYLAALKAVWKMQMNSIWPKSPRLLGTGRTWKVTSMMDPGQELMQRVLNLIAKGKLKVLVDSEWPFNQVLEAYDIVLSGRARGKVIIKVGGDSPEQSSSM